MSLYFDQGKLRKMDLSELIQIRQGASLHGLEIKLRGFVRCKECLNSIPLDMYLYEDMTFPHDKKCSKLEKGPDNP